MNTALELTLTIVSLVGFSLRSISSLRLHATLSSSFLKLLLGPRLGQLGVYSAEHPIVNTFID